MNQINYYKEKMINIFMSDQQLEQTSGVDNTLDIVTASYRREINFPIPRYIKLNNSKQVKNWFISSKNKKLIIELKQDYWDCWYNVYWKSVNGNKKTDISQSYYIEPAFCRINIVAYNYRLEDEEIENIEPVEDVPIDQVAFQTNNNSLLSEVHNPLLLVETIQSLRFSN